MSQNQEIVKFPKQNNPFLTKTRDSLFGDENQNPNSQQAMPVLSTFGSANSCHSKFNDFFSQPNVTMSQKEHLLAHQQRDHKTQKHCGMGGQTQIKLGGEVERIDLFENESSLQEQQIFMPKSCQLLMQMTSSQNHLYNQQSLGIIMPSHSQPNANSQNDRYIPMRPNQSHDHINEILLDNTNNDDSGRISLLSSGDDDSSSDENNVKDQPDEFKILLASQLVQGRAKANKRVYHHSLSQNNLCEELSDQLPIDNHRILPRKLLSFQKQQYSLKQYSILCQMQDEDGRLIIDDRLFQNQLFNTKQSHKNHESSANSQSQDQQQVFKPRKREFPLPSSPVKILAAPRVSLDPNINIIDWAPQSNPFETNSKLAIALDSIIYLVGVDNSRPKRLAQLAQHGLSQRPCYYTSVSFDRSGEAIAVGTSERKVQIYDVERCQQIRTISSHGAKVGALSWNRSILAPYLLTSGGSDAMIFNHDVRAKNSEICVMHKHRGEICSLSWSVNQSHEMMQTSDPSNIYLATGSNQDKALGIWKLNQISYQNAYHSDPWFFDRETFNCPVKALAWSPNYEGLLATGGGYDDQIIRVWNFKVSQEVVHTLRCSSPITSLNWRKTKLKTNKQKILEDFNMNFCEELITTHGEPFNEMKLWQVNKYMKPCEGEDDLQGQNRFQTNPKNPNFDKKVRFWFTKQYEWESHEDEILHSSMSPDSQHIATVGADETIRIWRMFEKYSDYQYSQEGKDENMRLLTEQELEERRKLSKQRFERQDKRMIHRVQEKSKYKWQPYAKVDLQDEIQVINQTNNEGLSQLQIR
ncbi:wd40 repeat-containing protein [Stylonychia lemnae]|uniref:Wd40 repeat-containing protein n=1 Tax=Stylonychia lemnae TaxID=5949 RepID=A0A078A2U1_STYLE|nr:wd40 repeat-containing protein [Stylonychia lemnae]|eukprot:CDW76425.1 wd40 repeat-containing protein [Stylonychia lemnae]